MILCIINVMYNRMHIIFLCIPSTGTCVVVFCKCRRARASVPCTPGAQAVPFFLWGCPFWGVLFGGCSLGVVLACIRGFILERVPLAWSGLGAVPCSWNARVVLHSLGPARASRLSTWEGALLPKQSASFAERVPAKGVRRVFSHSVTLRPQVEFQAARG